MNLPEYTSVNGLILVVENYYRHMLVRDLIQETGRVPQTEIIKQERTSPIDRLETRHKKHQVWKGKELVARVFCYKQSNRNEIQVSRMQHGVVCYPMF